MLDILSPTEAHRFAAEQRIAALQHRAIAERLVERTAALVRRAECFERNALAWDRAARGEWEDVV